MGTKGPITKVEYSKLAQTEDGTRLGGEGDLLGIVQEILILPYRQMVYAQPRICSIKLDAKSSLGFSDTHC